MQQSSPLASHFCLTLFSLYTVTSSESVMTEEERAEFYRTVPPMMYHFPHMHFMQMRMRRAQMEQQMQQER